MPRGTRFGSAVRGLIVLCSALTLSDAGVVYGSGWASGPTRTGRAGIDLGRTPLGIWIVEAKLNGRVEGRFLLDTGAAWCGVTSRTAARLRLSQVGEQVQVQTASGLTPMPVVRIAMIEIGGHRARDVQAVILPTDLGDLDGLIGMSFLNDFTYSIDARRGVLRLE